MNWLLLCLGCIVTFDGFGNIVYSIFRAFKIPYIKDPWWFQVGRFARGIIGLAIMGLSI